MKKQILLLLLTACCMGGYAQKGLHSVGATAGYAGNLDDMHGFSAGVKYQYYLSSYFRLSPSIKYISFTTMPDPSGWWNRNGYGAYNYYNCDYGYYEITQETSGIDIAADLHCFFTKPARLRPYLIVGISSGFLKSSCECSSGGYFSAHNYMNSFGYSDHQTKDTHTIVAANFGLGLNWELNYRLTLQAEITRRQEFGDESAHFWIYGRDSYYSHTYRADDKIEAKDVFSFYQGAISLVYNF